MGWGEEQRAVYSRPFVDGLIAERYEARAEVKRMRELLAALTDPDPCWYDHHGYCQAHSLHPAPCPHTTARRLLAGGDHA